MAKTTVTDSWTQSVVDGRTGEIIREEHGENVRTICGQEPPYIKLYIQDLLYLRDMPKGLANVLYALLQNSTFADKGLRVYLPTGLKKELIAQLGTTRAVFDNALMKLCRGGVIERVDTGVYALNPYLFGRGEWRDIDKIRATWDYDAINGRSFSAVVSRTDGTSFAIEPETQSAKS